MKARPRIQLVREIVAEQKLPVRGDERQGESRSHVGRFWKIIELQDVGRVVAGAAPKTGGGSLLKINQADSQFERGRVSRGKPWLDLVKNQVEREAKMLQAGDGLPQGLV